ncbi:MAG: CHAT domain-containing protein [Cyanobacteria bacterium P01_A01_bin.123]
MTTLRFFSLLISALALSVIPSALPSPAKSNRLDINDQEMLSPAPQIKQANAGDAGHYQLVVQAVEADEITNAEVTDNEPPEAIQTQLLNLAARIRAIEEPLLEGVRLFQDDQYERSAQTFQSANGIIRSLIDEIHQLRLQVESSDDIEANQIEITLRRISDLESGLNRLDGVTLFFNDFVSWALEVNQITELFQSGIDDFNGEQYQSALTKFESSGERLDASLLTLRSLESDLQALSEDESLATLGRSVDFQQATDLLLIIQTLIPIAANLTDLTIGIEQVEQTFTAGQQRYNFGDFEGAVGLWQSAQSQVSPLLVSINAVGQDLQILQQDFEGLDSEVRTQLPDIDQYTADIEVMQGTAGLIAEQIEIIQPLIGGIESYFNNDFREAENPFQDALEIFERSGNTSGEAFTLRGLGVIYTWLGDYQQAVSSLSSSLELYEELEDLEEQIYSLEALGSAYTLLGQSAKGAELFNQGLDLAINLEDDDLEATMLGNLGISQIYLDNPQQAIAPLSEALEIFRQGNNIVRQANALEYLGLAHLKIGQYQQSITLNQQSIELKQPLRDRFGIARSLLNIGDAHAGLADYEQAIESYYTALVLFQEIEVPLGEGEVLGKIGQALLNLDKPELAIVFLKHSVEVRESIRGNTRELPLDVQLTFVETFEADYRTLADLLLQQDRILEAQQVLDLLKVQELNNYLRGVRGGESTFTILRPEQVILERYDELQNTAIEIGQELAQLRQIEATQRSPEQTQRIDQLVMLQQEINAQFNAFLDSEDIQGLLDQLSRTAQRQNLNLEDLSALQDDLGQLNAAILYPLILEDRLELVITTPNSPPLRRTVEIDRSDLNRAISDFRQALRSPSRNAETPAQILYDWLIRPLEADLQQAGVDTIIYAPDGQLRYVPLAALHDGDQWLIQRYQVNNITARSLQDLETQPTAAVDVLAAAFADNTVNYAIEVDGETQNFPGLPFAGREVELLASTVPMATPLIDEQFSLAAVRPQMNDHSIVHFATHAAFVPGEPESSFIVFGNGDTPTLADIKDWNLSNVDLVVLSACETGLGGAFGNGEEILGLGYQFQRAGARAVVASLWKVSDGGTQVLMNAFYTALDRGMGKAEALQWAQTALINGDETVLSGERAGIAIRLEDGRNATEASNALSHPYYWAPFVLIGNGL